MKKRIAVFLVANMVLLYCGNALAEIIHLKDGSITKGEIIETLQDSIKVKTKFGEITIPKSDIERVEYGKEEVKKEAEIQPAEKENIQKYEREKLGIRTVDVYYGTSSSFGSAYYSKFLNTAFGSSVSATSLTPAQKWIITKGQFDITHLDFLRIVEPERAITVKVRIDELIESKEGAYAGCFVAAILGAIAFQIPLYFGNYIDPALDCILLIGGGVALVTGIAIGVPLGSEIPALKQMLGDPLAHFDNLEYTQEKIDEYNKNLKIGLGISF